MVHRSISLIRLAVPARAPETEGPVIFGLSLSCSRISGEGQCSHEFSACCLAPISGALVCLDRLQTSDLALEIVTKKTRSCRRDFRIAYMPFAAISSSNKNLEFTIYPKSIASLFRQRACGSVQAETPKSHHSAMEGWGEEARAPAAAEKAGPGGRLVRAPAPAIGRPGSQPAGRGSGWQDPSSSGDLAAAGQSDLLGGKLVESRRRRSLAAPPRGYSSTGGAMIPMQLGGPTPTAHLRGGRVQSPDRQRSGHSRDHHIPGNERLSEEGLTSGP